MIWFLERIWTSIEFYISGNKVCIQNASLKCIRRSRTQPNRCWKFLELKSTRTKTNAYILTIFVAGELFQYNHWLFSHSNDDILFICTHRIASQGLDTIHMLTYGSLSLENYKDNEEIPKKTLN